MVIGFLNNKKIIKTDGFQAIDLNEWNVQRLFNQCIVTTNTRNIAIATLFPTALGYERSSEKIIHFDKQFLINNKKAIEYLFGQLYKVHNSDKTFKMSTDDFNTTYTNAHWTSDKTTLLKLLYLGVSPETLAIVPFTAETSSSMISPRIKPTLSPKDPNFPAWWEGHKAEWEGK